MDENKYNDLDNLFRSRLRSESTTSGDWNTPSDDVFDRAMSDIGKRKKRPFPFLWLLPLFLIAVLTGVIFWQQARMSDLQARIAKMEVTENDKVSVTHERTDNRTSNDDIPREKNDLAVDHTPSGKAGSPKAGSPVTSATNQKTSPDNNIAGEGGTTMALITDQDETQKTTTPASTDDRGQNFMNPAETDVARNSGLTNPLPPIQSELLLDHEITKPNTAPSTESQNRARGISLLLFLSPEMTTLHMTDLPVVNYALTEYDQYYFGYSLGIGGQFQFNNKWSLDMTGGFHHTENKSEFVEEMPYNKQNENQSPGQPTTYQTSIGVASPVGGREKNISMNVDNVNIPDREMIINRTHIDHSFEHVSFSLGPRFHFLNNGNLNASVGAGVRINYLLNTREKMETGIYYRDQSLTTETFEHRDMPTINRFFGGLYGSLGIDYRLSEHYSVGLQSGYYRSLTSMKEYDHSDAAKTYLNSFNLNLNFQLHF